MYQLKDLEYARSAKPRGWDVHKWQAMSDRLFQRMTASFYWSMTSHGAIQLMTNRYYRLRRAYNIVSNVIWSMQFEGKNTY
jgi:hypothetical protein